MFVVIAGGLLVGLLMGALGGGGAILAVPLLTFGLGLPPEHATVGSLVVVGAGAASGLIPHARSHNVRPVVGLVFGALGTGGSALAAQLSGLLDGNVLLTLFSVLLLVVAATMIRKNTRRHSPPSRDSTGGGYAWSRPRSWAPLVLTATAVGFLTGLFGVGGGFIIVPALTLVVGLGMRRAIGTSMVVILVNSTAALALHATALPHLEWDVVVPFALVALVSSVLGAAVGSRVDTRVLSLGFAGFLVLTAGYTAVQSVPPLLG